MNIVRNEFTWKNVKWEYDHPDVFYLPQWQTVNKVDSFYVAYKALLTLFYFCVLTILFCALQTFPFLVRIKAGCYYTLWIFLVCTFSALLSLISVGREYRRQRMNLTSEQAENPILYKLQWIFQSIALDSSVTVSLGYFSLEFFYQKRPYGAGTSVMHLWNTLFVLMDLFISSVPVKLIHIYPSMILGTIYGIFTYIYYISGGFSIYGHHYLYRILDYKNKPGLVITAIVAMYMFMFVSRLLVYGLFKIREKLYYKYYYSSETTEITRHVSVES